MSPTTDTGTTSDTIPSPTSAPIVTRPLTIRIVGIGGAGGNAVAHMAETDLRELRPLALHTNARILEMTPAPEKILLGGDLTHGLGAGGDPSLARAAAEHESSVLKGLCQNVDLLFIVTGLGGGTGTGAAPVLARIGKEAGALVLGLATLPFDGEGGRRRHQAEQGLAELRAAADAVICLPNQKLFQIFDENTSVLDGFKKTNDLLSQGIRGIWHMLTRPGLIHVDFADLRSALRDQHAEACFATVEAQGEGRSRELIEQLLASPLLDGGQALDEADAVLINLIGGADLTMADVKRVMDEINRRAGNAQLIIGASIGDEFQGRLGLTLVASRRNATHGLASSRFASTDPREAPAAVTELESRFPSSQETECVEPRAVSPSTQPPSGDSAGAADVFLGLPGNGSGRPATGFARRLQQGNLPLEIVAKGRFAKSHPTLHRGEDLDVPTYVRRGIPLN